METKTKMPKLAVDVTEAMYMFSLGKDSIRRIGELSGASFKVGRRHLYRVDKLQAYIDQLNKEYIESRKENTIANFVHRIIEANTPAADKKQ